MFQFTTTTVINSNLDSSGKNKYVGTATNFNVLRVNNFKKDNITKVYKRAYSAGEKEISKITVPQITAGKVMRLVIDLRLSEAYGSEYATTFTFFKKPLTIEILATNDSDADAAKLASEISKFNAKYGFSYITASVETVVGVNNDKLVLTATNNNQRFNSVTIWEEDAAAASIIAPQYLLKASATVTTAGKIGFGDDEFMLKSIMVPTYENTRAFGTNKEERPIIGGNYTQYTLHYKIDKSASDPGINAGGYSTTVHIFYVKSDLVSAFEDQLEKTFPAIETIGGTAGPILISGDEVLDLSNSETTTLTASNYTGTVVWTSATAGTATINSATGVVTAVAAGTTVITATAGGKTGTFLLTVVA